MLSLVIPIYKNEPNLDRLLGELSVLKDKLPLPMEVVFVVDGSPDRSLEILQQRLPAAPFPARLLSLSRNFGSFSAIAAGLEAGAGDYFAVLAADLQEPPELVVEFCRILSRGEADVTFGVRTRRSDPWLSEFFSRLFWSIYRAFIIPEMPRGGVDVFGDRLHAQRCAGGRGELPGNHGDGERGGQCRLAADESGERVGRRIGDGERHRSHYHCWRRSRPGRTPLRADHALPGGRHSPCSRFLRRACH